MPRPSRNVLAENVDKKYMKHEALETNTLYAVFYEDKLITLRTENMLKNIEQKYNQCVTSSLTCAENTAKKLNKLFHTDKFSAKQIYTIIN